jgi:hypothetical protein
MYWKGGAHFTDQKPPPFGQVARLEIHNPDTRLLVSENKG